MGGTCLGCFRVSVFQENNSCGWSSINKYQYLTSRPLFKSLLMLEFVTWARCGRDDLCNIKVTKDKVFNETCSSSESEYLDLVELGGSLLQMWSDAAQIHRYSGSQKFPTDGASRNANTNGFGNVFTIFVCMLHGRGRQFHKREKTVFVCVCVCYRRTHCTHGACGTHLVSSVQCCIISWKKNVVNKS